MILRAFAVSDISIGHEVTGAREIPDTIDRRQASAFCTCRQFRTVADKQGGGAHVQTLQVLACGDAESSMEIY